MQLELAKIRLDGGTQPRESLDQETVTQYARNMREGLTYDPIDVVYDGTDYWCWDGFHRCMAGVLAKLTQIEVRVTQGTLEDAQWLSLGANKNHGVPRSNDDKKRAVRIALTHPRATGISDHQIAVHVGVSQPFVGRIRKRLAATNNGYQSPVRTGRDGRTINTAKIGKRASAKCQDTPPRKQAAASVTRTLARGHSPPVRLIPLQFCPDNPQTAADTLMQEFSREFVNALVQELVQRLNQEGAV
jgi:hypothetical protein